MESISDIALQYFDSSNSGIVMSWCAENHPIIACNDAFGALTGDERPEITGKNCHLYQAYIGPKKS